MIREAEDALFARWRQHRASLIPDGVADETLFAHTRPRVLFLLKEVNDPGGGGWDLRQFLAQGARPPTWNNVTRWVQGIRALPDDMPWDSLAKISAETRRLHLSTIAAVNLKKTPGGMTTEATSLWEATQADAEYIREQLGLYDADVTVCAGSLVANAYFHFLRPHAATSWQRTSRGIAYLSLGTGRHVISFSHPEARIAEPLLHYALMDALRAIQSQSSSDRNR